MLTFSDLNADRYDFSCWTAFQDDEDVYSTFTGTKCLSNEEPTSTSVQYESLGPLRLREEINKEVMFASKMLWVDTDLALILLLSCHWNWEKLLAQWFESPSDVLASVGELEEVGEQTSPEASSSPSGASRTLKRSRSLSPGPYARKRANLMSSSSSISSSSEPCGICFETILEDTVGQVAGRNVFVPCGHRFCSSCWARYLACEIADEGRLLVRCMAYQCRTVLLEGFIKAVAVGGVYKRWQTLLAHSFVSAQKDTLRFCPAPSCDQALHISAPSSPSSYHSSPSPVSPPPPLPPPPSSPTVSCANAHTTCFTCALPGGHSPVPCGLAALWRVLLREDARRLAAEAEARLRAEEARKHAAEVAEARRKEEEEKWRLEEEERRKQEEERRKREREEMLETAYWKYMHSKSCPQCGTPIEKVGGCNYMRCTRCDGSFCWGCGKKDHKNGSPTCTASGKISKAQAKARAKAEIDRLMALPASIAENASRKNSAVQSTTEVKDEDSSNSGERLSKDGENPVEGGGGEKEMEALDVIPKSIDGLVEVTTLGVRRALRKGTRVTWIEAQSLQNALTELTSSAKTLRWTCAMVNLMSPGSRKQGFEVVNTDLRSSVEHLCHLVTGFFNEGSMTRDRCRAISDKTTYVRRRHESLVKDASKGFSEGTWEWAIQFEDFDLST